MSGKHGYSDRLDKIRLEIERQNRELAVVAPELLARATPAQPSSRGHAPRGRGARGLPAARVGLSRHERTTSPPGGGGSTIGGPATRLHQPGPGAVTR
mgnify:CR=1 FL=1